MNFMIEIRVEKETLWNRENVQKTAPDIYINLRGGATYFDMSANKKPTQEIQFLP